MASLRRLTASELRRVTDVATVSTAGEAHENRGHFIGQERAAAALRFGLTVRGSGFNIFVAGSAGTGKETLVRRYCEEIAATLPAPGDWCYVNDFQDEDRPRALLLPPGGGQELAREMDTLLQDAKRELKLAFRAESYNGMQEAILAELEDVQERELAEVDQLAEGKGFRIERRPESFITVPLHENGEPLSTETYSGLDSSARASLAEREREVTARLKVALSRIQEVEETVRERVEALQKEVAEHTLQPLFVALHRSHAKQPEVLKHLAAVEKDVLEHIEDIVEAIEEEREGGSNGQPEVPGGELDISLRYKVNSLTPHKGGGAPVVFENHPTLYNLLGRIGRPRMHFEPRPAAFIDVKCGSLHRANGGFLVLTALDLLKEPFAWEGLKRALRNGMVSPASPREEMGLERESLRPEPIPLDVVVLLLGDVGLYHELLGQDPDFGSIFTVKAHFDETLRRNPEAERDYAWFIHDRCREKKLLPFTDAAVARVVDEAAVLAGAQDMLTACFRDIADLLQESDYLARRDGLSQVDRTQIEDAVAARQHRVDLYEEHLQEMTERGEILLDTEGKRVGQVNALAVFDQGDYVFARPSRISCTVGLGQGGLVDIEREAELGGPIHTKGVLILRGFLLSRFTAEHPLALSASMAFEQSYGLVDGDSASFAELAALLSAISNLPLRQDIAVTGSINQMGLLQAIGGVTEKVTGFFRVCRARGLTGEQGVIVPESNAHQLMLPTEVVEAVRQERFHVWAARDVAGALELLTGIPTGEESGGPDFPPGSVYAAVASRLRAFTAALHRA